MAASMPFVVIPDGTDAWELAHLKPFLMKVVATVAFFHDLPKQQVMVKDLMRQISEKMILRNDKSLELLQGILILIAWCVNYHSVNNPLRDTDISGTTHISSGRSNRSSFSISPCH